MWFYQNKMKIVAIVQARMGSTRLLYKTMAELAGKPLLWHIIDRLKTSKEINDIVVATSNYSKDDVIMDFCKKHNIKIFRGSETDVLNRIYLAAKQIKADVVARICADNPFLDIESLDEMTALLIKQNLDYVSNVHEKGAPHGTVSEVMTFDALQRTEKEAKEPAAREHVTVFIRNNPQLFKIKNYEVAPQIQRTDISFEVNAAEDLEKARKIYDALYKGKPIPLAEAIRFLDAVPSD